MSTRRIRSIIAGVIAAALLILAGFTAGYSSRNRLILPFSRYPLVEEAHKLLATHFLGELPDTTSLQRGMIRGLVDQTGDPFTVYVEPASHELESDALSGEYGGIGAFLSYDDERNVQLIPFEGGPAARAGVVEGDVLLQIDDTPVEELENLDEVSALIRGPEGTSVSLLLAPRSEGDPPLRITIQRESIPLPSVSSFLMPGNPDIGVIRISSFSEKTRSEVEEAYQDLSGRGVGALVLDLRGNSGGLLESSLEVARFFLDAGLIIVEDRGESGEEIYRVGSPGPGASDPLVVLVDGGTASGAEVVAAALQSNARAPLIGSKTFGKGSVQAVLTLSDGSSLHVTTARWLTPERVALDGTGLLPDVEIQPDPGGQDAGFLAAVEWIRQHVD